MKQPTKLSVFYFLPCYWLLTWCLTTARRCSPPEDCHLHHGVGLPLPPPPHLDLVVPLAPAPLQPPRHPQEPGSSALLLRACLPAGHQSDWQPGRCIFSHQQSERMYSADTLLCICNIFSWFKCGAPHIFCQMCPHCPVWWAQLPHHWHQLPCYKLNLLYWVLFSTINYINVDIVTIFFFLLSA